MVDGEKRLIAKAFRDGKYLGSEIGSTHAARALGVSMGVLVDFENSFRWSRWRYPQGGLTVTRDISPLRPRIYTPEVLYEALDRMQHEEPVKVIEGRRTVFYPKYAHLHTHEGPIPLQPGTVITPLRRESKGYHIVIEEASA